jgi:GST-like protein
MSTAGKVLVAEMRHKVALDHPIHEEKRPRDRYATESARLLGFLDDRLAGRDWVLVGFDRFLHVQAWFDRGLTRPAVQRGLEVTLTKESKL